MVTCVPGGIEGKKGGEQKVKNTAFGQTTWRERVGFALAQSSKRKKARLFQGKGVTKKKLGAPE